MKEVKTYHYQIAEFNIKIRFIDSKINDECLIPSFRPFYSQNRISDENLFFQIDIDDSLTPKPKDHLEFIGRFDTGNGMTSVERATNGTGYQYIIKNINGHDCCLLQTDKDFTYCKCALNGNHHMRSFGINNALMLVFAFKGSYNNTLLIHASLVRNNGFGYAFTAKSGTGKSTHVSLWLQHIKGCDLMNDDNPIIRVISDDVYIYGSPWSGKTPCYRNTKARLGAITRIDRATTNSIEKLTPTDAFASLIPSCSSMKWDKVVFNNICNTITKVIEKTGIYILHCLPNKDAAIQCHKTISK